MSGAPCVSGCVVQEEAACGAACEEPAPAPPLADKLSWRPGRLIGGLVRRACGGPGCGGPVQPAVALESCGHPRFHPVPTYPVFLPRQDCLMIGGEAALPREPAVIPEPPESAQSTAEEIPAPLPESGGWKAKDTAPSDERATAPGSARGASGPSRDS